MVADRGSRGAIVLLWCLTVTSTYFAMNFEYYAYKLAVFAPFLLRMFG